MHYAMKINLKQTLMHMYSRKNKYALGTIHKRRLLGGVGRWGPPKGDLR